MEIGDGLRLQAFSWIGDGGVEHNNLGVFSWEVKSFWVSHQMFHGMSEGVFGY
jgi:hypothetical protein